eukprot:m.183597 g.183597  ORF g.183597 m.183597 type:complete len:92 (+) comp16655_c0_seq2:98-373(+)
MYKHRLVVVVSARGSLLRHLLCARTSKHVVCVPHANRQDGGQTLLVVQFGSDRRRVRVDGLFPISRREIASCYEMKHVGDGLADKSFPVVV